MISFSIEPSIQEMQYGDFRMLGRHEIRTITSEHWICLSRYSPSQMNLCDIWKFPVVSLAAIALRGSRVEREWDARIHGDSGSRLSMGGGWGATAHRDQTGEAEAIQ